MTQLDTICSGWLYGRLPTHDRTITEFESRFSTEAGCREYLVQLRWPEGFPVPEMWESKGEFSSSHFVPVLSMWTPGLGNGGGDFPRHTGAVDNVGSYQTACFNRRRSGNRGKLFFLPCAASACDRTPNRTSQFTRGTDLSQRVPHHYT